MTKEFIKDLMRLDPKQLARVYNSLYLQASRKVTNEKITSIR